MTAGAPPLTDTTFISCFGLRGRSCYMSNLHAEEKKDFKDKDVYLVSISCWSPGCHNNKHTAASHQFRLRPVRISLSLSLSSVSHPSLVSFSPGPLSSYLLLQSAGCCPTCINVCFSGSAGSPLFVLLLSSQCSYSSVFVL